MRLNLFRESLVLAKPRRAIGSTALLLVLLVIGCSPALPASGGPPPSVPEISYVFRFDPEPVPRFFLQARFHGGPHGFTVFGGCLSDWPGLPDCGRTMERVTVHSQRTGQAFPLEQVEADIWTVDHPAGEPIAVDYELSPSPAPSGGIGPAVEGDFVYFLGDHGLLVPEHLMGRESVRIEFSWRGSLPSGWTAATSFTMDSSETVVETRLSSVLDSLFFWGPSFPDPPGAGNGVHRVVWLRENPPPRVRKELTRRLSAAQSGVSSYLGRDRHTAPTWFVLPEPRQTINAVSLTSSILLLADPATLAQPSSLAGVGMALTAAHELVHAFLGDRLDVTEGPVPPTFFTESFAEFVARRALYRVGLLNADAWAVEVSRKLEALQAPRRKATPANPWPDPYVLGDLVLLLIDHEIQGASGGEADVRAVFEDLTLREAGDSREPGGFSWGEFRSALAARTSPGFASDVDEIVRARRPLRLPPGVFADCLEVRERPVPSFDSGFDVERSAEAGQAVGVRADSPAWRAGLRDGDHLLRWSVQRGRSDVPVELTVSRDEATWVMEYLPTGRPVASVQEVVPVSDSRRCDGVL